MLQRKDNPVAQQIGDQATYIQQQQQPIEVIDIYSDSSDSESESDPVTPSVSSYANILRQQDLNRGTGDVSFQSYSQSAQCDEYEEYEKEFKKELQCSWRNETYGDDYDYSITNAVTIRNWMYDPRHSEGDFVNLTAIVAEV